MKMSVRKMAMVGVFLAFTCIISAIPLGVNIFGVAITFQTFAISFIGYVNYQEQHKKLMLALKDDKRFRLSFVGTRALELESFCKENGIEPFEIKSSLFNV